MRPAKWYTARPAGRITSRPVINLPPPTVIVSPPSAAPLPKQTALARLWSIAKIVGPSTVAIAALVISLLAYQNQRTATRDQQRVDQAAAAADRRHDAEQVSFVQENSLKYPYSDVIVENDSTSVVSEVSLLINVTVPDTPTSLYIGSIPPCTIGTLNVIGRLMAIDQMSTRFNAHILQFTAVAMTFLDSNSVAWRRSEDNDALVRIPNANVSPDFPIAAKFRTVAGCT